MAEPKEPRADDNDDLSVEELEDVAGGALGDNTNCTEGCNGNCPCNPYN